MATETRQRLREEFIEQAVAEAVRSRQAEMQKVFANGPAQPLSDVEREWLAGVGRRAGERFDRDYREGDC